MMNVTEGIDFGFLTLESYQHSSFIYNSSDSLLCKKKRHAVEKLHFFQQQNISAMTRLVKCVYTDRKVTLKLLHSGSKWAIWSTTKENELSLCPTYTGLFEYRRSTHTHTHCSNFLRQLKQSKNGLFQMLDELKGCSNAWYKIKISIYGWYYRYLSVK